MEVARKSIRKSKIARISAVAIEEVLASDVTFFLHGNISLASDQRAGRELKRNNCNPVTYAMFHQRCPAR